MLVIAAGFFVLGIGFIVLSRYRGESVGRFVLPPPQTRRVWLPGGMLLVVMGALFVVMFITTMASSPLRQAETRSRETQLVNITMNVHTAYFSAHTQNAFIRAGTFSYSQPARVTPLPDVIYSDFELTVTELIYEASVTQEEIYAQSRATNRAMAIRTIEGGDDIALTATVYRSQVTDTPTRDTSPTSRPTYFPTPTRIPGNSSSQSVAGTATALARTFSAMTPFNQTVAAAARELTATADVENETATATAD